MGHHPVPVSRSVTWWWKPSSVLFQNLLIYFRKSDKGNTLICVGSSESLSRLPGDETQQVPKINTEMEMSRHREHDCSDCRSEMRMDDLASHSSWLECPDHRGSGAFCESREEVITGRLLSSRHIFGLRVSVVTTLDYWPLIGPGVTRPVSDWLMGIEPWAGENVRRVVWGPGVG